MLMDLEVDGRRIEAVTQLTKHGFVFVFDRSLASRSGPSRSGRCRRATYQASAARRVNRSQPGRRPSARRA
jgi:glucose dehydrogenase